MILSVNEKKALLRRQKELEEYEEEMARRFAQVKVSTLRPALRSNIC